jgi:hypothetical protein
VEVNLQDGGKVQAGRVKHRARDAGGELHGTRNINPILDTRMSKVEFPDGSAAEYSANVITENMFAQCNPEGEPVLIDGQACGLQVGLECCAVC